MKKPTRQNIKIFISTSSFGKFDSAPIELLKKGGWKVELNPSGKTMTESQIMSALHDVNGLIAGTEPLTAKVFDVAKKLMVVSRVGVGMDSIDQVEAKRRGIRVFNTPGGPTHAVAELTIGLILDLLRKISLQDRNIRTGVWKKTMGNLLRQKTVGIIGFGKIGKSVAGLLKEFKCKIIYFDPFIEQNSTKYKKMDLKPLLGNSDIVTLHLAYSKETHHIINEQMISCMKQGAYLVNAARGGLVDEDALERALKENKISGAALDTFEREPYGGPLLDCSNVILTPHIGSYALESRVEMEIQAARNLIKGMKTK